MNLDKLDTLILDAMSLDYQLKEIYLLLEIPKSTMNQRIGALKERFNVRTNTALIFKYALCFQQTQ
jgi:hypothetical protein